MDGWVDGRQPLPGEGSYCPGGRIGLQHARDSREDEAAQVMVGWTSLNMKRLVVFSMK